MSHVANVMLAVYVFDRPTAAGFVAWLEEECPRANPLDPNTGCGSLRLITGEDNQWGGPKHPECSVYAGTLNHADLTAVVQRFAATAWRFPRQTQLMLMDQEDSSFRLWMIDDDGPRQYAPIRDLTLNDTADQHDDRRH